MNRKKRRAEAKHASPHSGGMSPDAAVQAALDLHRKNQMDRAEAMYRRVLEASPEHPDALHFLGVLRHQQGNHQDALDLIRKAVAIAPGNANAQNNLGSVLNALGQTDEAVAAYRACLRINPQNADALSNLGRNLKESGNFEGAVKCLQRAIAFDPRNVGAYYNLGTVLKVLNRTEEAIAAYRKSIALSPHDPKSYKSLGTLLYKNQRVEEASEVFAQWLRSEPDNAIARHMLSACSGQGVPERASDAFVSETFDDFAPDYDNVLEQLGYQGPELVRAAVAAQYGDAESSLQVLDAGCGTGLCAAVLRPYACGLTGIDLSRGMVNKAKELDLYDELEVGEMTSYLLAHPGEYDLVVSADTLNYFGKLEDIFLAAHDALRPGGHLVFTLEKIHDGQPGENYRLNPHGRYSHPVDYVWKATEIVGLEILGIETRNLRNEGEDSVEAFVVTSKKPAQPDQGTG